MGKDDEVRKLLRQQMETEDHLTRLGVTTHKDAKKYAAKFAESDNIAKSVVGEFVMEGLEGTLGQLALDLQKQLLKSEIRRVGPDYPNNSRYIQIGLRQGIERALKELNRYFRTKFESDYSKLHKHFHTPVQEE